MPTRLYWEQKSYVPSSFMNHLNKKAKDASLVASLWEPRPFPGQRLTASSKERIASLYQQGYNIAEIADWFYQDKAKTRKVIIGAGIRIRRGRIRHKRIEEAWESKKKEYFYQCAYCGDSSKELTRDHIIPLSAGGENVITNIVPACHSCNSSKGKRELVVWKLFKGMPLDLE